MKSDTTEKGLETLIMRHMTGTDGLSVGGSDVLSEDLALAGGTGWIAGRSTSYDREYAIDTEQLFAFLKATQPEEFEKLGLGSENDATGVARRKFLARLQGEITRRGVIDVIRNGIKHGALIFDLFFGTPTPGNKTAEKRFASNRFSVTRQLRYSRDETQRSLDLALFINGLPVATFELKNSLKKQTVEDAVGQYKKDRDSRELLFAFGCCVVHFAVDDHEVRFCTHLKGKASWFLPFNLGYNDGAGNPPNPDGLKTDYLWKRVLTPVGLTDILENYAQVVETKDLKTGKKIIITTVQKFPWILDEIGSEHRQRRFALLIDEAHSSQSGKAAASLNIALSESGEDDEDETIEDKINRVMEAKKMLPNASYFAFTATPKNKTLQIFGVAFQQDGETKYRAFHPYTMKQATQEGFILDVLKSYTPIESYCKLVKAIDIDPDFDTKKATKKLRKYVESHDHAIGIKAEIMVDHFQEQVIGLQKIGGQARAMVVTSGVERAIQYFFAMSDYLKESKSPYKAIVAFSGEHEYKGHKVTEASLNGFPSNRIADNIREDPYRFLICADKFQTGYDEPLLHTMYVDKPLSGIKAVQTLSRLNRAHPQKHDVFVLDFMNDTDTIQKAFADYYRTTILSKETDANKLHDLKTALDGYQVYSPDQINQLVTRYLNGADRDKLDPILDSCAATYTDELDEDGQVDFKGKAKAFCRTYDFLASILPYSNADWERLSIFLNFLVSKLPAPKEDDLAKGILESIDMDSYRVEKNAAMQILLPDQDAEIEPVPTTGGGHKSEPQLEKLSNILKSFNDQFGNIPWTDADRIYKKIIEEIPPRVAADPAFQNARKNSDKQNARIEHDKALGRVIVGMMKDDTELFKQFSDNEGFRRWLTDTMFGLTYSDNAV